MHVQLSINFRLSVIEKFKVFVTTTFYFWNPDAWNLTLSAIQTKVSVFQASHKKSEIQTKFLISDTFWLKCIWNCLEITQLLIVWNPYQLVFLTITEFPWLSDTCTWDIINLLQTLQIKGKILNSSFCIILHAFLEFFGKNFTVYALQIKHNIRQDIW